MEDTNLIVSTLEQQEDLNGIRKEIEESSDRAVGTLCGSILEQQLKKY